VISVNVVLISPSDSAFSIALNSQLKSRQRSLRVIDRAGLADLDDKHLREAIVVDADAVLILQRDCRTALSAIESSLEQRQAFRARCESLSVPYLFLSDGRVFASDVENDSFDESDAITANTVPGIFLAELEKRLCENGGSAMILRTGPLIASRGASFLNDCLATMRGSRVLSLNDKLISCPTPVADLARVISGIIDQIACGVACRGVYHYCSSGRASAFEFAEVVCAFASQFVTPMADIADLDSGHRWQPNVPELGCEQILQDFGIKQLPWRAYLPRMIKTACEEAGK
jgi:dTDP-4-dehydrorhamnose reductase